VLLVRIAALACIGVVLGGGVVGCGKRDAGARARSPVRGDTLTIYSSLPLRGASRELSQALVDGETLALEEAGNRAGRFRINYVSLDDSAAAAGDDDPAAAATEDEPPAAESEESDPGVALENARRAAGDDTTIAYLGNLRSSASMVSLPILNKEGIGQVGPVNTYVGLTTDEPGSEAGEPEKYYPSGRRTYVRLVPRDTLQGMALGQVMRQEGCDRAHLLHDGDVPGAGLARIVGDRARTLGLRVTGTEAIDANAADYRSLASDIRADCVVFSGAAEANAVQLFKDLSDTLPRARLFGLEGLARVSFTDVRRGGLPNHVAKRTLVTAPALAPEEFPPKGQRFFDRFSERFGQRRPHPYAIYGYEAMKLALDAIERAGARGNDRLAVVRKLLSTTDRESVLGEYDIDENGDTSLTDYGLYRIVDGRMEFEKVIETQAR
jgi:branched-chain amino acid transport system substrate-binding protein